MSVYPFSDMFKKKLEQTFEEEFDRGHVPVQLTKEQWQTAVHKFIGVCIEQMGEVEHSPSLPEGVSLGTYVEVVMDFLDVVIMNAKYEELKDL